MNSRFSIRNRNRFGFMLLEMLVAFGFLAVAMAIVIKMHQARLEYDRHATDRLRQQLAIENVSQHLASLDYSDVLQSATTIADQAGVRVVIDEFTVNSRNGLHLTLNIDSDGGSLNHHVWRLEPQP
ncbi:MAG: hypothetical protein KDB00_08920 [Planctomycetales bacterium]|nr:hypothetical protein [Planctomycetales bacterium]